MNDWVCPCISVDSAFRPWHGLHPRLRCPATLHYACNTDISMNCSNQSYNNRFGKSNVYSSQFVSEYVPRDVFYFFKNARYITIISKTIRLTQRLLRTAYLWISVTISIKLDPSLFVLLSDLNIFNIFYFHYINESLTPSAISNFSAVL